MKNDEKKKSDRLKEQTSGEEEAMKVSIWLRNGS